MKRYLMICFLLLISAPLIGQNLISGTIQFQINTDIIVKDSDYYRYVEEIVPEIKRRSEEVDCINLIGSASPEGRKERNIELANLRANKIYSYISRVIPKNKIVVNNDYDLFLDKTGYDEWTNYTKLRATYIEVRFKEKEEKKEEPKKDTTIITSNPVVNNYYYNYNYYYYGESQVASKDSTVTIDNRIVDKRLAVSIYNNLIEDLVARPNIGVEVYFAGMSLFLDGSFSCGRVLGKENNIYYWNLGFRKYFNSDYSKLFIEAYGNGGYFDNNLFTEVGKYGMFLGGGFGVGYKFKLGRHWKIYPHIRLGILSFRFKDYYSDVSNGGIDVSFGNYTDGRTQGSSQTIEHESKSSGGIIVNDRIINSEFFKTALKGYWIGPTYIGLTIQRDFYITRKRTKHENK